MKEARSRAARMGFPGSYIFPKDQPPIHKRSANGVDIVIDVEASEAYYAGDYKSAANCVTRFANIENFRGTPQIPGINVDVVLNGISLAPIERSDETKAEDVANLLNDLDRALRDSSEEVDEFRRMTAEVEQALGDSSTAAAEPDMVPALEEDRDTRI